MPAFKIKAEAAGPASTGATAPPDFPGVSEVDIAASPVVLPDFAPVQALRNAFRFWWLIVILMMTGGAAGWLVHSARPPLYEAVAQYTASIDYVRTGPLTQFEEDIAFEALGKILYSTAVVEQVISTANAQGIPLVIEDLPNLAVMERRLSVWQLRVRHPDPVRAETLANIWIDTGRQVVEASYAHALAAQQLEVYSRSLERCLMTSVTSEPAYGLCEQARFADLQADLHAVSSALHQERMASQGLFVGLVPGAVERATATARPVADQRNQFVLAGALLGLILAIAAIELGLPARWRKRKG